MSNYSKATNFTSKDSLPTGNPSKIVKGAEIDTEFVAIASAVTSKADINSPTFTGTPAAPTAISGTNTTQLATTAFVKNAFDTLGTMSTQNANAVAITGGTIAGVTISSLAADLAVADGGTGSSTFTANSVVLGNGTSALNGNMVAPSTTGNLLTSNGTTWTSATPAYVGARASTFTSTGTFTVPAGITAVKATVVGAGGAGGQVSTGGYGAGGGGGGGVAIRWITGLTSGATVAVTVGTAPGGTSSFGSYASATGGSSGGSANDGAGGAGGSGTNGDINLTGGQGGAGYGGGGGGGASGGGGGAHSNSLATGSGVYCSPGAASLIGGAGGVGAEKTVNNAGNATGYGNGGGGNSGNGSGSPWAAGTGSAGIVLIEW